MSMAARRSMQSVEAAFEAVCLALTPFHIWSRRAMRSGRAGEDHLHAAAQPEGGDHLQQRREEALLVSAVAAVDLLSCRLRGNVEVDAGGRHSHGL